MRRRIMANKEVLVKGINVRYQAFNQDDYICLTDIAKFKNSKEPKDVIKSWMRSRSTLEYLSLWESFYNPNFKGGRNRPPISRNREK